MPDRDTRASGRSHMGSYGIKPHPKVVNVVKIELTSTLEGRPINHRPYVQRGSASVWPTMINAPA